MLRISLAFRHCPKETNATLLDGYCFWCSFFVITQAQTSGFEQFFIRTILGTNGAIRISDQFQDPYGTVQKVDGEGKVKFIFNSREGAQYRGGVHQPDLFRTALRDYSEISGISEIIEGNGVLNTGSRKKSVEINGIRWMDHLQASDLSRQLIHGSIDQLSSDQKGVLLGARIFRRLNTKVGQRIRLQGGTGTIHLRVCGVFETGVSQIDKNRIYIHSGVARSFLGRSIGGSIFQVSLKNPELAPEFAQQLQSVLNHRVVSWQEREKVWLDVFKALRVSSGITVSCILLLSGLGIFNVFAILVIEKIRDIAILRSIGFSRSDVSAIFLWQGAIVLTAGILLGSLVALLGTYLISIVPLRIRGIFSTDSFVVNWDVSHYIWASSIALIFVSIATWIPARRASHIEPAKIIRETL